MPDLEENTAYWDGGFHWRHRGDEWSAWWGSPEAEWQATIYPRIREFLPARLLLEIAPGFGRWTQFLRDHCERLVGIDLSRKCVWACRRRFWRDRRLKFRTNDGKSLRAAGDATVDFAFSFDSLVHVEADVMDAYLAELARVLRPEGVAFLHHSNMAAYPADEVGRKIPHWRSGSVSADTVAERAAAVGLSCFKQELIGWGDEHDYLNDAFSWIAVAGSAHDGPREVVRNDSFMHEARASRESLSAGAG